MSLTQPKGVLSISGLERASFSYQLDPQTLTQLALDMGRGTLTANGVLNIPTGKFTGRSPEDRFIVRIADSAKIEIGKGFVHALVKKASEEKS